MAAPSRSGILWDAPAPSSPLRFCAKWRGGSPRTGWARCASAAAREPPGSSKGYNRDMATTAATLPKTKGGAFLIEERTPQETFTPEDLTEEHRAIARTADEFWNNDVAP